MRSLWIIGSSGHAKVLIELIRAIGEFELAGVLDDDPRRWSQYLAGVEIRGGASPEEIRRFGIKDAVIAVGDNRSRAKIAERLEGGGLTWAALVHPTAYVASGVSLGEGTIVLAGAIVQTGSVIGRHAIVNTASSVDHDCNIGDFVHIGPGVHLAGRIRVGLGTLLGVSSCVVPGRTIGKWATVGAGGVVVRDVPDGVKAVGIPARAVAEEDQFEG